MTIHHIDGDLFAGIAKDAGKRKATICHIVNDAGGFGAGFSGKLDIRHPGVGRGYRKWADDKEIVPLKLGNNQYIYVGDARWVVSMCAQHGYGRDRRQYVDYQALRLCLQRIYQWARPYPGNRKPPMALHMPMIGAGLGGGDWNQIEPIIEHELAGLDVYIYKLDGWTS